MKYVKGLGLLASAAFLGLTLMAANAAAQVRIGVSFGRPYYPRPVVRRYYAPPIVYGYGYGNPYYWGHSERYYDRRDLQADKNHLYKDENKYYSDGYITPHEQENLDKDYNRIYNDRRRLHNDW